MKRNGNAERQRRENRAEARWVGSGERVSPSLVEEGSGKGAVPPPQKIF